MMATYNQGQEQRIKIHKKTLVRRIYEESQFILVFLFERKAPA